MVRGERGVYQGRHGEGGGERGVYQGRRGRGSVYHGRHGDREEGGKGCVPGAPW